MPALQIRDLPVSLYEPLKQRAVLNHRSLAQEATVAIESYVGERSELPPVACPATSAPPACAPHLRRAAAIERIRTRGALVLPPDCDDAAALVRSVRDERDRQLTEGR